MYADLHCHSIYSDGTNTPAELIEIALRNNVKVISLVDHDTIQGIPSIIEDGNRNNIEVIPGVEISTSVNGIRIHILGYYINYKSYKLINFFNEISKLRTHNTKLIFDKLCRSGKLKYSWDNVLEHNKGKIWLCSSHVFEAMKSDKIYTSYSEWNKFYNDYFSKKSEAYIDLEGLTVKDAIENILEADGIPVIAHPKKIGDDSNIEKLIKYGVQGIEVYYPVHSHRDIKRYLEVAKKYYLLITGGTDWHRNLTEWNVNLGDYGISDLDISILKNSHKLGVGAE